MIPIFKKLHFQIIDFVEAFHTQYHTILVTEFLPGEMVMVIVVKGMVNGDGYGDGDGDGGYGKL